MNFAQRRLDLALEAAQEYSALLARGDMARMAQLKRTIDDLVGYWDQDPIDGSYYLSWPAGVERVAHGSIQKGIL